MVAPFAAAQAYAAVQSSAAGAMGGALSAQNMPAGGAEFRLELPLAATP